MKNGLMFHLEHSHDPGYSHCGRQLGRDRLVQWRAFLSIRSDRRCAVCEKHMKYGHPQLYDRWVKT